MDSALCKKGCLVEAIQFYMKNSWLLPDDCNQQFSLKERYHLTMEEKFLRDKRKSNVHCRGEAYSGVDRQFSMGKSNAPQVRRKSRGPRDAFPMSKKMCALTFSGLPFLFAPTGALTVMVVFYI